MVAVGHAGTSQPRLSASPCPTDERPTEREKMICWLTFSANHQLCRVGCNSEGIPFLNERTGNVFENKGALWKTWERSWNVHENTGTYPFNPGMLLKRQVFKSRPSACGRQQWTIYPLRPALSPIHRVNCPRPSHGLGLDRKSRPRGHSRESGSPSSSGPTWTPAHSASSGHAQRGGDNSREQESSVGTHPQA
jgi:hypothetical protein